MNTESSKVALVTGASRGIGQAIAVRLAADGFRVVVLYAGQIAKAEQTVAAIETAGGQALALQADVADAAGVDALFAQIHERLGRLDVVVHSAGVMSVQPIAAMPVAEFDRQVATNLRGTFLVMQQAAKYLGEGGRFIALSSSVIGKSFPGYGPYIASKAGVEGLVRVFAHEMRGRGITVNAVAPGPVATELFFQGKSQAQVDQIVAMAPLERIGQPDDIAGTVSFLAGPDGGWINAQVLRANGGYV